MNAVPASATPPLADRPNHIPASLEMDIDLFNPPHLQEGLHEAWHKLREKECPEFVWTPRNGGHWIATRGPDIARMLGDYKNFSNRVMHVPKERMIGNTGIPNVMDPPEQTEFRSLLNKPLSQRAVLGLQDGIRSLAVSLMEPIVQRGECEFVTDFALQLPLRVFMNYVDLPVEDMPKLRHLAEAKVRPTTMTTLEVMKAFSDYLTPYVQDRLDNPKQDLLSQVLSGKVFGRSITVDEGVRMCTQIVIGGLDTVAAMLSFTFLYLARNPAVRRRLAADPLLIPGAVDEFLRRFPLITIGREVTNDQNIRGTKMLAGDIVVLPTILHGLDDDLFPEPLKVDFERPKQNNSTFGQGPHRCPGSNLAATEMKIVLEEWLKRMPEFSLADDEDISFKGGFVGTITKVPLKIGKSKG